MREQVAGEALARADVISQRFQRERQQRALGVVGDLLGAGLLGWTMSEQRLDRVIRCRGMSRRQWLSSVGKRVKQCCCLLQL
jgi:hypothetical protein